MILSISKSIWLCGFIFLLLLGCTNRNEVSNEVNIYNLLDHFNLPKTGNYVLLDFDGCSGCLDYKINAVNTFVTKDYTVLITSISKRKVELSIVISAKLVIKREFKVFERLFSEM
ncbi:hypothetical protein GCM10007049_29600 [Echinicola pacifica]|uniref:Uncharacterized protein n=1 Tax=Echinicola pacifica TaxID=346377 RepID=A0A918UUT0_9BACT|nr:hypothetical protein GCM10007049_29600 [Echinicola pacifica]